MVMRENGWTINPADADGAVRATHAAMALAAGVKVDFEVSAPVEGDWTVRFVSSNGYRHERSGPRADIASDAIAWAHRVASS